MRDDAVLRHALPLGRGLGRPRRFSPFIICTGPDFAGGGPGANIEDGSSLIIHWSSGSHKRSTNWANHINYNFGEGPTGEGPEPYTLQVGGPGPWPPGPS